MARRLLKWERSDHDDTTTRRHDGAWRAMTGGGQRTAEPERPAARPRQCDEKGVRIRATRSRAFILTPSSVPPTGRCASFRVPAPRNPENPEICGELPPPHSPTGWPEACVPHKNRRANARSRDAAFSVWLVPAGIGYSRWIEIGPLNFDSFARCPPRPSRPGLRPADSSRRASPARPSPRRSP